MKHLFKYIDERASMTSDSGVEVKVTEYQIDRRQMDRFMPPWLAARRSRAPLRADGDTDDEASEAVAEDPGKLFAKCEGQQFLRNAWAIPGVGHCIHNILKDFPRELRHYDSFFKQL